MNRIQEQSNVAVKTQHGLPKAAFCASKISPVRFVGAVLALLLGSLPMHAQTVTATVSAGASTQPYAVAANPATNKIYMVNRGSNTVTVIDGATNNITTVTDPGASLPVAVAVNPVTNKIYVANSGSNNVTVIDGATNTFADINAGSTPSAIAVNTITNEVYVANSGSASVTVLNGAIGGTAATAAAGSPITVGAGPSAVAVNPITNKIYVANGTANTVSVINGSNNTVLASPSTGVSSNPISIAVNPVTNKIYVADNGSGSVSIIDGATNGITTFATGTNPFAIAVNPVTNKVYVVNQGSGTVTVIDPVTNNGLSGLTVGNTPYSISINPITNYVFVTNRGDNSITVIVGATSTSAAGVAGAATVGTHPQAVAINPVTNKIYIANNGSSNFTVIDGATNKFPASVSTGVQPFSVAVNPVTSKVYVANFGGNTITVIDPTTVPATVTPVTVGNNPYAVAVNPVTNKVYVANYSSNTVTVIDAGNNNAILASPSVAATPLALAVNAVTNRVYVASYSGATMIDGNNSYSSTSLGASGHPVAVAVNPITNKIYIADATGDDVSVIDGVTNATTTLTDASLLTSNAIAVNTVTNKVYVANMGSFSGGASVPNTGTVTIINGATSSTAASVASVVTAGTESFAIAVNEKTNRIYVANKDGNNVGMIDANNGNSLTTITNPNPNALTAYYVAVNPTTNKIYVANFGAGSGANPGNVTVIDGATNTVTTITDSSTGAPAKGPSALAVNPITNQTFVANQQENTVTMITEQQQGTIAITPGITALAGNLTNSSNPTFTFAATNTFTSGVNSVLYQIDGWQGPWTAATNQSGNTFTATTAALTPGFHIIYAYATDGEEGTSTITGLQGGPLTGNISGYGFLVTAQSTIVQTTPTISWTTPSAITYGTAINGTQLNATASANGSPVPGTFVYTPASGTVLNAGNQTLSVTFTPTDNVSFSTATASVTQVVNKVVSTINWANPSPIAFGTALSATQLNATVSFSGPTIAGTLVYTPAAGTVLSPGTQNLSAQFTPNDTTNYTSATAGVTVSVTGAASFNAPTVTGTVASGTTPDAVAVNPATNTTYVTNATTNNVTVINGATNTSINVGVGSQPSAVAVNPVTNTIYVANRSGSSVSVINGATNTVTTTITVGNTPFALAVNSITNTIYVANQGGAGTVSVINGATNTVTTTVTVGSQPSAIAVNPATNTIYVANRGSNTVSAINGSTNGVATITDPNGSGPTAIAVNVVTNKIYVANTGTSPNFIGSVTVINGAGNGFTNVGAGTEPIAISLNPVTNKIFVANEGSNNVTVLDGATNATVSISAGVATSAVAVNPLTNKIFAVSGGASPAFAGTVTVIDGATNTSLTVNAGTNSQAVAINPVTGKIYVANSGGSNVTVLDGATNSIAATPIAVGSGPQSVVINPITKKIYIGNLNGTTVTVIDGTTNVPTTVNVGANPTALALNPVTNTIYAANFGGNTVTAINGTNNSTTPITVGANPLSVAVDTVTNKVYAGAYDGSVTVIDVNNGNATTPISIGGHAAALAVNPVTDKIYVANNGNSTLTVIDGATNNTTSLTISGGTSFVAVNSVTNKIYAVDVTGSAVTVIDGATNTLSTVGVGNTPYAIAVNSLTNKIYVTNSGGSSVSVIDGTTNTTATTVTVPVGTAPQGVAVDRNANKIYVANSASSNITVIDGLSNVTTTLTDPNVSNGAPGAIAVNASTSQVYVANYNPGNVTAITAQQTQSIAITSTITPLAGNQTTNFTPAFNFTATNSFTSGSVDNLVYQIDSWQGTWTKATNNGSGAFSGNTASLLPGFHILYAYATDGEAATSTITGLQGSPLIGNIAAYGFVVTTTGATAAPTSLTFGNQPVTVQSSSQTVTLSNGTFSPTLTFSISFGGTNPADFSEVSGDTCGPLSGQLVQNSSCTIKVAFTPTAPGARSATLIITDNSNGVANTTHTITLSGFGTGNLSPVIAWANPGSMSYGEPLTGTQLNATASYNSAPLAGTFVYTPAVGTVLGAGTQSLSVTFNPDDTADYKSVTQTAQVLVNKATLTVTANNAVRLYGQSNPALSASYGGFVNGDTQTSVLGANLPSLTTTATSASPVTTYPITTAVGSLTATNYTFTFVNGVLTVNKATPIVAWTTPAAITYGTLLSGTQLNATASLNATAVGGTFVYTPASGTKPSAGNQALSVTFNPTDTTDLTSATGGVTLVVNQATPTIAWATPANIPFGTALSGTQLNATASSNGSAVAGTFVYTPAAGVIPNSGSQTLSVGFTPTDSTDFTTATATTPLVVTQATPSINWATPAAITYGTALSGIQLNAAVTYLGSPLPGTFSYSPAAGTVLGSGSQNLSVIFTPTDSINYKQVTTSTTLAVSPAPTTNQGAVTTTVGTGTNPHAVAVNPATNKTYVVNQGSNSVTVIDGATNTPTTITVGSQPSAVAVNPVTNKAYVANYASNTVTVIDSANGTSLINVGTNPTAIAVNSITNKIYVADQGSNDVMVIDGVSTSTTPVTAGSAPSALALNPVTGKVYVANYGSANVTVIDSSNNATSVNAGTNPFAVAVNPVTNKAYVANFASNNVTVIDGSNGATTVTTGLGPDAIAVNPITNKAYVANNGSGTVTIIDGSNNPSTVSAGGNPFAVAVDQLTNQVYVTNQGSGNFTVIDGNNNPTNITGGVSPGALGVNPVTNKVYIANAGGANVSVVDGATNTVATFSAGSNPQAVAVNPVTSDIYVANIGANTVTVIGGSTTTTVNTGSAPYAIAINPLTNKVYVANNGSSNVTVIDGVTHATTTVAAGSVPYDIGVNVVTNKIYVVNYVGNNVTVIDGATNAPTTVQDPNAKNPFAVAINDVTNKIYVANVGDGSSQGTVTVIDGATNNTTTIPNMGVKPFAVAVNTVTNKIYVGHYLESDVEVIDGATNVATTVQAGVEPFFLKVNPITNKIYVVNKDSNTITVLDGITNNATTVSVGTNPFALAVNPITNKIYVANYGSNNISVIDGLTNYTTTVTDPNAYLPEPTAIAINPVTNQTFVANYNSANVTVITEEQVQSIPVTASITPLAGNQSGTVAPIFSFTSTNTLTSGTPTALFYQVDTWGGVWTAGISQGAGSFGGTTAPLQSGMHIIYAYATEGEAAGSTTTGTQNSPLIGNITAYTFLVPAGAAPPAGVSLSPNAMNFGNQQKTTTSSPIVATLSNGSSSTLHFSIAISGTNATDFAESTDTCSTLAGQLAPSSSCSVVITFTPALTGTKSATLTVTDDASGVAGSTQTATLSGTGTGNQHPTITWATPASITYGTALDGTQLNATASFGGSPLPGSFVYTPTGGAILAVGTQTLSVTFTPTDTLNFAGATQTVQINVTKATLTVSSTPATRAYGQANPTFTPNYIGFVNSDTVAAVSGAPTFTTTATTASPVASYAVSGALGTLTSASYTFNFVNGTLAVTAVAPTITWPTPAPMGYGTPLSSTQLNATASFNSSPVTGNFVYTPAAGTVLGAGTQTLSVTFTPTGGGAVNFTTGTASVSVVVTSVASFLGTDTVTQGNWQGIYGTDGYSIANSTKSLPGYAVFSVQNEIDYTWTSTTTDIRALQAPTGGGRIAPTWYNAPNYTFDLNFTDSQTHEFALYALDWDQKGRAESIQILDANTNTPLDTETVSNFSNGTYLIWNISGHVKIVVTVTTGANAVLSGAFFGGSGSAIRVSVSPQSATLGTGQVQQFTAAVTGTTNTNVTWSITPNVGTLTPSGNTASYTAPLSITPGQVTIKALSSADSSTTGSATINLTNGAVANFISTDTVTKGSWIGAYGADGYAIANSTQSIPAYATFSVSGQVNYTWAASTTDPRALQNAAGTSRIASTWCCGSPVTLDLNFTDGTAHQFALYALDWDGVGRSESIQISDATSNTVLDTRTLTSFNNGTYLVWNIIGHVKINVTVTGGPNSALSGAFFGGAGGTGGGPVGVSVTPQSVSLTASQQQVYTATVTGAANSSVAWSISPNVGTLTPTGNTATYTAPATITTNQAVTVKALSAQDGTTFGTATANLTAGAGGTDGTAATFVKTDTQTSGSWLGVYGADGYAIANSTQSIPSYATFSVTGQVSYTWLNSTSDTRALQNATGGGRIASTWCCASPSYSFDVNFTDGNTHQFALYALDWDGGSRAETIQILNAATNAVLDTRSASNFGGGTYLVWTISGHVKIVVTWTGGSNSVLSGAFFGGAGTTGGGGGTLAVSVAPQTTNLTDSQQQQLIATLTNATNQNVTWSISPNVGTLTSSGNTATYTAPATIPTAQSITVKALSVQDGTTFGTATLNLTADPVGSGGTSAAFVKTDTQTSGSWMGVYGADGYAIANTSQQSIPSYATFSVTGQVSFTWAASTSDPRALQNATGGGRVASTWCCANPTYSFDVNITDGNTHQFALYALDWDGGSRAETIQILNASTNAVLDTRSVSGFFNGTYVVWNISGHVKINVTWTGGSNSVLSGAFFGGAGSTGGGAAVNVSVSPQIVSLSANQQQQFLATVTNAANQNVTWSVSPNVGTLTAAGNTVTYTAPATISTNQAVTVKALSAQDGTTFGTATVNLTAGTGGTSGTVATYVTTDTQTSGSWLGVYGADGYAIANTSQQSIPSYATFSVAGQVSYTWAASTTDTRALQNATGGGRIASTWCCGSPTYSFDVNFTDGNTHQFALYAMDWDDGSRAETIQILNASTNAVLDTRNISGFGGGAYVVWNISGHVKIVVTWTGGSNSVLSGAFFGGTGTSGGGGTLAVNVTPQTASLSANQQQQFMATVTNATNQSVTWSISPNVGTLTTAGNTATYTAPTTIATSQAVTIKALSVQDGTTVGTGTINLNAGSGSAGTAAAFVTTDVSTQGNWKTAYGTAGYAIANSVQSIPSFATFSVSGQVNYTWVANSTDIRALQNPTGTGRIASTWCCAVPSYTFDLNFTDGNTHTFALYGLDWDGGSRAETIQILNATTNAVLDTRSISNFYGGIYVVWNISGHVKINVTWTGGSNSVLSGAFFNN